MKTDMLDKRESDNIVFGFPIYSNCLTQDTLCQLSFCHIEDQYHNHCEKLKNISLYFRDDLDVAYEKLLSLSYELKHVYESLDDSQYHDEYLSLLLEISSQMAEILGAYDEVTDVYE